MSTINPDQLLTRLKWRYATKQFDATKKIPAATWAALEETLVLTPSSYGLQPWKFLVITDAATREKLVPASWGQRQVADCSHFVVFVVKQKVSEADVDAFIRRTVEVRGGSAEALNGYRNMMVGDVVKGPRSPGATEWAARQVYIALGNFMTAAALLGVDTCPMEGFEPPKYDEILGLGRQGLTAAVACPAGYRAAGDKYAALPKVRFLPADVLVHI